CATRSCAAPWTRPGYPTASRPASATGSRPHKLMPRRSAAQIRPIEPDARHRNRLVQQLINKVMSDGKKSLAERIVYDSLAIVGERSGEDPVETLESAVKSLPPVLEVRSRRVGGATYQVPVEVPARRARTLAVRWLVQFAR